MKGMWNKMTGGGECQRFDRWMTDSLAGELTPEQQTELDAHLDACAVCRAEFAICRNAWALTIQSLLVDPAPTPLSDAARKTIEDAATADLPEAETKPARSYNIKFVWMEIAASVIIVGVVLFGMLLPSLGLDRKRATLVRNILQSPQEMRDYAPAASTGPGAAMPDLPSVEVAQGADKYFDLLLEDQEDGIIREVRRDGGSAHKAVATDKGAGEGGMDPKGIHTSFQPKFKAQDADSSRSAERRLREEESRFLDDTSESGPSVGGRGLSEPQSHAEAATFGGAAGNGKRQVNTSLRRSVDTTIAKHGQANEKLDRLTLAAPSAPPAPEAAAPSSGEERKKTEMSAALFRHRSANEPMAPMTTPPDVAKSRSAKMADASNAIADGADADQMESTWKATSDTRTTGTTSSLLAKNKQDQPAPPAKPDSAELDSENQPGAKDALRERGMAHADAPTDVSALTVGGALKMPPTRLSETTFDVDAAMYRLLGGSESEVRNYLAGKGIVLDAEGSVSYDAATGKLILRHRPDDLKTIQDVVDVIRATADEQRELSNGLPFIKTGVNPTSTFSIDVDTASYALAQRYLRQGQRPPPERVRPEEFINAFDYAYRSPENALFGVYLEAAPDPFRPEHTLFRIGVQGRRLGADVNRPSQFTLLIDTSGSMGRQDRIGLAKKSVSLLLDQLRPQDCIAVLTCGYRSQVLVPFTPAAQRKIIERLVAGLQPQGEANLERGFVSAYRYALDNFQAGAGNRVILFTDGIAGFGASDADTILAQVETARRQGVTNTVVGFGGDGNDNLLEALANRGDGSYVFLNNEDDARTLFEKEFAARFHEIARDVKIQVEFNPGQVAAYRQIGYQNRQLSKADFRNDQVDAGEVGAGQSVTALYELQPVAMAVLQNDAIQIRRQPLATVRIRYRRSDTLEIEEREFYLFPENLKKRFDEAEPSFQLAAAVAEFAETLRYPDVPGIASPTAIYDHVQRLYGSTYRNQPNVHEFMTLVGAVR